MEGGRGAEMRRGGGGGRPLKGGGCGGTTGGIKTKTDQEGKNRKIYHEQKKITLPCSPSNRGSARCFNVEMQNKKYFVQLK